MFIADAQTAFAPVIAELHRHCFQVPWSESDIRDLLCLPTTVGWVTESSFLLCSRVVDEMEILTYELENSVNKESDDDFVIKVFSDGFVICWMKPKVESAVNLAFIVSGKDEKKLLDHYQPNIDRLEQLEIKLKKYIRDYGYHFGSYGTEQ